VASEVSATSGQASSGTESAVAPATSTEAPAQNNEGDAKKPSVIGFAAILAVLAYI
jgi:hypothetical protein